jgi:cytochrome c556
MRFALPPKTTLSLTCATAMLTLLGVAYAAGEGDHDHEESNNEARYRHTVMEAMGSSFGALALIMTNRVERPEQLATHAKALAETTSIVGTLFPPGSEGGDALPLIWQEPEKVAAAAKKAAEATAALAAAAESGDRAALAKAFKAAGESCKGCHESYKAEDD